MTYTLRSMDGREVTVEADYEAKARELAMMKLYGGVVFTLPGVTMPYIGEGLDLIRVE